MAPRRARRHRARRRGALDRGARPRPPRRRRDDPRIGLHRDRPSRRPRLRRRSPAVGRPCRWCCDDRSSLDRWGSSAATTALPEVKILLGQVIGRIVDTAPTLAEVFEAIGVIRADGLDPDGLDRLLYDPGTLLRQQIAADVAAVARALATIIGSPVDPLRPPSAIDVVVGRGACAVRPGDGIGVRARSTGDRSDAADRHRSLDRVERGAGRGQRRQHRAPRRRRRPPRLGRHRQHHVGSSRQRRTPCSGRQRSGHERVGAGLPDRRCRRARRPRRAVAAGRAAAGGGHDDARGGHRGRAGSPRCRPRRARPAPGSRRGGASIGDPAVRVGR